MNDADYIERCAARPPAGTYRIDRPLRLGHATVPVLGDGTRDDADAWRTLLNCLPRDCTVVLSPHDRDAWSLTIH